MRWKSVVLDFCYLIGCLMFPHISCMVFELTHIALKSIRKWQNQSNRWGCWLLLLLLAPALGLMDKTAYVFISTLIQLSPHFES